MISVVSSSPDTISEEPGDSSPVYAVLARYGSVPQVARFVWRGAVLNRGQAVIAETERGEELAVVLEQVSGDSSGAHTGTILRIAAQDDLRRADELAISNDALFPEWIRRIREWNLQLELIDLEQTLDRRLILYVLNDRNAETTRLALLAAAGGLGIVHVQPVSSQGIVHDSAGGCGSCGCGTAE